jgi:putative flippase GtrA
VTALGHYLFVRHRHNWGLLTRFSVVGSTGVVVNLLVFWVLLATAADPHAIVVPLAGTQFNVRWYHGFSTIAFLLANLWNFQFNRIWTFQSVGRAPWLREYGPFLTVGLVGQALGLVVLTALLHPHSPVTLPAGLLDGSSIARSRELWAQAITLAIVTPVSFVGNKLWTFRAVRGPARSSRRARRRVELMRGAPESGAIPGHHRQGQAAATAGVAAAEDTAPLGRRRKASV